MNKTTLFILALLAFIGPIVYIHTNDIRTWPILIIAYVMSIVGFSGMGYILTEPAPPTNSWDG